MSVILDMTIALYLNLSNRFSSVKLSDFTISKYLDLRDSSASSNCLELFDWASGF